jgi:hypothetical protein
VAQLGGYLAIISYSYADEQLGLTITLGWMCSADAGLHWRAVPRGR